MKILLVSDSYYPIINGVVTYVMSLKNFYMAKNIAKHTGSPIVYTYHTDYEVYVKYSIKIIKEISSLNEKLSLFLLKYRKEI